MNRLGRYVTVQIIANNLPIGTGIKGAGMVCSNWPRYGLHVLRNWFYITTPVRLQNLDMPICACCLVYTLKSLELLSMDIFATVMSMNECSYINRYIQGYIPSVAEKAVGGKLT